MKFSALAAIYASAILQGLSTYDEAPTQLQPEIKAVLGDAFTSSTTSASGEPSAPVAQ